MEGVGHPPACVFERSTAPHDPCGSPHKHRARSTLRGWRPLSPHEPQRHLHRRPARLSATEARSGEWGAAPPPGSTWEPAARPPCQPPWDSAFLGVSDGASQKLCHSDPRQGCWLRAKWGHETSLPQMKSIFPRELTWHRTGSFS